MDTSVIVKLYIKEDLSFEVSNWIRAHKEPIPLTAFHELEFKNALYLKQFRSEITEDQIRTVLLKFENHYRMGVYYHTYVDWPETLIRAIHLAHDHTSKIGVRSLDILHVASALAIQADRFFTLDDRQAALAASAGLKLEDCTRPPHP